MDEILSNLKGVQKKQRFFSLFPYEDREHIVVTFLAVLELMKRKQIIVRQDSNFDDFFVQSAEEADLVGNH